MISAVAWVPRGAAREVPKAAEPSPEELQALEQQLKEQQEALGDEDEEEEDADSGSGNESMSEDELDSEDADGGAAAATAAAKAAAAALASNAAGGGKGRRKADAAETGGIEAALRELDMDHYDDDDDVGGASILQRALNGRADYHKGEDPYLKLEGADEGLDSEEEDDLRIKPSDLVILAARSEDEINNLEVWIYEEAEEFGGEANVYVHHEIVLPNFPLCVAWMDCDPRAAASHHGNLVAVGTLDPGIEIWDLDTLEAVEPVATLGGEDKAAAAAELAAAKEAAGGKLDKKKKKKLKDKAKKRPTYLPGSHQGGVLGLSWNRTVRNVLASGGEDTVVKVWDVVAGRPAYDLAHHTDKVQAVAWNPAEAQVLLTGSFDKTAALVDVRAAASSPAVWQLPADCEALAWCPHDPTQFLVSCENGLVLAHDARRGAGGAPLWQLHAHDKPTCALSWCGAPGAAGLLATGSTDKVVKLWDVREGKPSLLTSQDLQVGAVFTLGFCGDVPHLLAVGGAGGSVSVWDVRASAPVASRFPSLLPPALELQPRQQQPSGKH